MHLTSKMVAHKRTLVRQKQIITAAGDLILRFGSEHLTVRHMAREIGVSEGAIYRHFKSKKEILSFLVDDIEAKLIADLESNRNQGINVLDNLDQFIVSIQERKGISFQVIAEIISLGDRKLNKKIYSVVQNFIALIRDLMAEGVRDGLIKQDVDLNGAATMYFGIIQGLVNIWTLSSYGFDLTERYRTLWNIFAQAIVQPAQQTAG